MKRFLILTVLILSTVVAAEPNSKWEPISNDVIQKLDADHRKIAWPGNTAGVTVDPANGDVYMIVPDQGIWKSSDRGATFARADKGEIGGRCETSFSLNMDPAGGGRLACFMLDGKCGMTLDGGNSWKQFTGVGRNWDYAAVDWSEKEPRNIFAALHESGGQYFLSNDAGKSWKKLGVDPVFDVKGGVGIFDDKTLVMTKGDGILRSTDSGGTWTKVSDLVPTGRIVKVFKDVAYWLSKDGLLVSTDKGATWKVQGNPTEATLGPWFKDARHISAAGAKGIVHTDDGGTTWKSIAALPPEFDVPKAGWFSNVGWDPTNDLFYASKMSKPTYRLSR